MQKRLRFGLVIGVVVVVLAIGGFFGGRAFIRADSNLPGSNCTANGAYVTVAISNAKIESSLASFSPGDCYGFIITNNDKQAHDFLIEQPGSNTVLAAATNIAAGGQATVDYQFAPANSETPVNLVYSAAGDPTPLGTEQLFLAQ
ncbi:MAG TPA: hypothetical protein VF458_08135 [Ktedonobacteraceae bacterium]